MLSTKVYWGYTSKTIRRREKVTKLTKKYWLTWFVFTLAYFFLISFGLWENSQNWGTYSKVFAAGWKPSLIAQLKRDVLWDHWFFLLHRSQDWKSTFVFQLQEWINQQKKRSRGIFLAVTRNLLNNNCWSPHNFCNQDFFSMWEGVFFYCCCVIWFDTLFSAQWGFDEPILL